jgi:DNA-binding FadR family transcriptional regulator
LVARIYDRPQDSIMLYEVLIGLIATGNAESARNAVRDGLAAIDTAWLERQGLAAPKKKKSKGGT